MIKRQLNIFLVFIAALFIHCGKGIPVSIKGTVNYRFTGKPVVGAKIRVMQSYGYNTKFQISSATTDENGKYKLWYGKTTVNPTYNEYIEVTKDSLMYSRSLVGRHHKLNINL